MKKVSMGAMWRCLPLSVLLFIGSKMWAAAVRRDLVSLAAVPRWAVVLSEVGSRGVGSLAVATCSRQQSQ